MAEYRLPEFTTEQRIDAAIQLINPHRGWGVVSALADLYGASRTLLYQIRNKALEAIANGVLPGESGRPCQDETVTVDKPFVQRVISILPCLTGTVRDIQTGLELILGVSRSVGHISQTLSEAGEQARAINLNIPVPLPVLGEADEIFQGRKPCLTVVDGRSFLVLNLTAEDTRDADFQSYLKPCMGDLFNGGQQVAPLGLKVKFFILLGGLVFYKQAAPTGLKNLFHRKPKIGETHLGVLDGSLQGTLRPVALSFKT